MRFNDTPELAEFRTTVRAFVREHWGTDDAPEFESLVSKYDESRAGPWLDQLASKGWLAAAWPREYGGAELSILEQFVLTQEVHEAGAPASRRMLNLVGPTIMLRGNSDQRREHLPPMLRGEVAWCQGFSEPGAGSDLASLQTRAVRDGDVYVVNGQKIWTSGAETADWMFMLTRTAPSAAKHAGITYLLMDMRSPGVSVRPLAGIHDGHTFNEVFFDNVRVPVRNRIGEENAGWYVAAATLDFERSNIALAITARKGATRLARYIRARSGGPDPIGFAARFDLAERFTEIAVAELLSFLVVTEQAAGRVPNKEASTCKLFGSEVWQRLAATKMRVLGTRGLLRNRTGLEAAHSIDAPNDYLGTVASTIAGGTSEIQRNIIATRALGLPR